MAALDLRPLSLGELLDRTFFLYRRHFLLFFGIAAIPYSIFFVVHLVTALLPILAGPGDYGNMRAARFVTASIGGGLFGFVGAFVGGVAYLFSLGATVYGVSEIYKGRETTIRECLRHVRGKTGIIFGVLILSGLLVIAGLIALVIPGIYLLCRICVAVSAALLEDTGPADSIRRSFALTKNFAGRAFMIYLLYFVVIWGVLALFQFPFIILIVAYAKQTQLVVLWTVLMQVGNFIGSSLVTPVILIALVLFYYDLRVRKEAFDLQMMMQAIGADPMPPPITGGVPSMFGRDAT